MNTTTRIFFYILIALVIIAVCVCGALILHEFIKARQDRLRAADAERNSRYPIHVRTDVWRESVYAPDGFEEEHEMLTPGEWLSRPRPLTIPINPPLTPPRPATLPIEPPRTPPRPLSIPIDPPPTPPLQTDRPRGVPPGALNAHITRPRPIYTRPEGNWI